MNEWQIFRRGPAPSPGVDGRPWRVLDKLTRDTATFRTWREAMDYADKEARTVEVVLPRAAYGDRVVADKGVYSLHVKHLPHCTDINLGGWDGVTVENRHLWGLAVHLAACAQHWEAQQ